MPLDIYAKTAIRWLPDYAIGVQEIDEDHQRLFSLAGQLQAFMRAGKGSEVLQDLLNELVEYTSYHFAHEEEFMQRIGYPHYREHCREHRDLGSKVRLMKERLEFGEINMTNEVMHFVADWLKCHTTTTDRRIGTYMRRHGLIV